MFATSTERNPFSVYKAYSEIRNATSVTICTTPRSYKKEFPGCFVLCCEVAKYMFLFMLIYISDYYRYLYMVAAVKRVILDI